MIFIQPMFLSPCQEALINQLPAIWDHSHMLKSKIGLLSKLVFCFCFLDHDDIFNSDPEAPVLIVAGLVRDNVSRCKGDFGVLDPGTDADWAFVDVEV
jgi:hypothetical protein